MTSLLYGQKTIDLTLPESVDILEMKPLNPLPDGERAVRKALEEPIGSDPLPKLVRGRKNACIVISDITRPVPNKVILPPLLAVLEENGIPREQISILIATGMHRANTGDELEYMVGREIMERYRIINHNSRNHDEYQKIDTIDGAPIEINKHYLDADLKILTGLIEPHFYAGFSGGRKAILPGLSSIKTMEYMHSFKMIDHPMVANCVLDENPFHRYGIRVAKMAGVDFILNVVINRAREVAGVFAGHYDLAHLAGCDLVQSHAVASVSEQVDMVISSGGGYPLDATFYQISKALINAKGILKKGGTIVVACECREGIGAPGFCKMMNSVSSYQEFVEGYSDPKNFVIDQWCVQNIYQALDHADQVYIYSPNLPGKSITHMGAIKVDDLQATIDDLLPQHNKIATIPDGPYVVGMLK